MLKIDGVTKCYGDLKAVDNLSFEIKKGEIFGLLGLNGAGKTTTFRMINGLLEPDNGSITLNGKKIDYSVTDRIGFLTEERSLLTKMTVLEQCLFYGTLKGMSKEDIVSKLDHYLDLFGINDYKNKKIKELSKGNQQKIQFICAIINDPDLLILDEPFSGLDPINVELFKKVIVDLSKKGSMIIFSSHRMEHVELFCKKILVLVKGKTVLDGYLDKIKKDYKKKDIFIKGDIDIEKLKSVKGVYEIIKEKDEYIVKIEEDSVAKKVFKSISTCDVTKFVVSEASLNEIFIASVGVAYE